MLKRICGSLLLASLALGLSACAALAGREPLQVNVVGIEPLQGQGLELRMAVKLRVQNPSDVAVEFDGVSLNLEIRGSDFASGVSDQRGTVPRFGEAVLVVPVSVSATSMLKQVINFATGDRTRVSYQLRGRFGGTGIVGVRFDSSGEVDLPAGLGSGATR